MMTRILSLFTVFLMLTACVVHEYKDVEMAQGGYSAEHFDVGDTVKVILANGDQREFKIRQVGEDTLEGEGVSVAYADMRIVQAKNIDYGPTVFGTGTMIASIGLLIGAIALASLAP